ncbi:MAG TPA: type III polyketide synthase [Candidatus Sumerlaeota bacterium]|nr:type III polyketide synthase [Candidatus Sumerlaeota bacterium]
MTMEIFGMGTAVPPHELPQDVAAQLAAAVCCENSREQRALSVLYRNAGIERRNVVLSDGIDAPPERENFYSHSAGNSGGPGTRARMAHYEREAPRLAEAACAKALASVRCNVSEVTHLIIATCSGFSAPGIDLHLVNALGIPATVRRLQVGFMGCHAAMNAMMAADGICAADARNVVLVCAVELCSLHLQYGWDPARVMANALFGDGAAAIVARQSRGDGAHWNLIGDGSRLFPDTGADMSWKIGDHGFEMFLSQRVPALIEQHLAEWLLPWLAGRGLTIGDVGCWAVHPGGPRILKAVESALTLPAEALAASWGVLRDCGNMSSPTTLFVLERLTMAGAEGPCVMLGFGPGLAAEVLLLDRGGPTR